MAIFTDYLWSRHSPYRTPVYLPYKIIIIIITIIVVVVVTDFSNSEPRLRRLVYRRSGGYRDRFRLRPDFEMSQWQRRRLFLLLLFTKFNPFAVGLLLFALSRLLFRRKRRMRRCRGFLRASPEHFSAEKRYILLNIISTKRLVWRSRAEWR